jgi:DNA-binding transcriptional MerR regulator
VFVRSSRELGFSLDQVRTLIHLSKPKNVKCAEARGLSKTQLKAVQQRIMNLRMIEVELTKNLINCEAACACGPVAECQILNLV